MHKPARSHAKQKGSKYGTPLHCNKFMVREIDATWNPIYDSILLMYQKLKDLGFEYRDREIKVGVKDELL